MRNFKLKIFYLFSASLILAFMVLLNADVLRVRAEDEENVCVGCHSKPEVTPLQVNDWKVSMHSGAGITCDVCHGDGHKGMDDIAKVNLPTPQVCSSCHFTRFEQFKNGKHAAAWTAMNAMPA
ncbi:MAG: multiheme c-type cytochrome, partial [bacterium]